MRKLTLGTHTFTWGERTYLMGIMNITPDSFSGDGLISASSNPDEILEEVKKKAAQFLSEGADILDIGGESTRPGSQPVVAGEETRRVVPAIQAIIREFPDTVISVDTSKAVVADEALQAGARLVNDVWGLRADPDLGAVAARQHAPVILMHNRSRPNSVEVSERLGNTYQGAEYTDLMQDVCRELMESVELAHQAGIPDEQILLDPGIGFGKTLAQNLELIDRLGEIRKLGYPVLLGPSRKSFIGHTLNLPPDQRLEGTAAAVAVGIVRGADIVRVHDVTSMKRVAMMTDALVRHR